MHTSTFTKALLALFFCITATITATACDASFTYAVSGSTVNFTGNFSGVTSSATVSWDFGDGGTAVLANPTHNYTAPGTYYACVTVEDTFTNCARSNRLTIEISVVTERINLR